MNVLLLPNPRDQRASQTAERAIRRMAMTPVALGCNVPPDAVVLVYGAEPVAYLTAGVYIGRKVPVAFFAPSSRSGDATGELMFIASNAEQLRNWLDDTFTWDFELGDVEPTAEYRSGP